MHNFRLHSGASRVLILGSFALQFRGSGGLAEKRMVKAHGMLRHEGSWRSFEVKTVAGRTASLYVGKDKNPHTVRTEIAGKRLLQTAKEVAPLQDWFFNKQQGMLMAAWTPVAKLSTFPDGADSIVHWNADAISTLSLDKDTLAAKFLELDRTKPVDVAWCL